MTARTAREIREAIRRTERERIKRRERAAIAVAAAIGSLEEARLRSLDRISELRRQAAEAVKAEQAKVAEAESELGAATVAALTEFSDKELAATVHVKVADVRRWARQARRGGSRDRNGVTDPLSDNATAGSTPPGHESHNRRERRQADHEEPYPGIVDGPDPSVVGDSPAAGPPAQ